MKDLLNRAGFEDCVLHSHDDYEPYGFVAPQLLPVRNGHHAAAREQVRDRVIEAEILAHCTMVGC